MSLIPTGNEPRFEEMAKVVDLFVKNVRPQAIAKELGIRKIDVDAHLEEWRKSAVGSDVMKGRVEELIASMDEHYSLLIAKAYEIIDEVDELKRSDKETMTRSQMLSQKKGALDLIAKLEKDRIDVLQKSGLLEAADMGDQLAAMEAEMEEVLDFLDHELCEACSTKVKATFAKEGAVVVVSGD